MAETIVLLVDDLMFLPRLEGTLVKLGYQPLPATNETTLIQALNTTPVLVIVDLFSQNFDWQTLLESIQRTHTYVSILGFGPHVDLQLREKALVAGCIMVVGRGAMAAQLPQLVKKYKRLVDLIACQQPLPPQLLSGIELFNQRQYFECHEVIEEAWREEPGPIREMYQGILQIGVACYHLQRQNRRGALKLLERGIPKIARFAPVCMGLNLGKLLIEARLLQQKLIHSGPDWPQTFDDNLLPVIELSK